MSSTPVLIEHKVTIDTVNLASVERTLKRLARAFSMRGKVFSWHIGDPVLTQFKNPRGRVYYVQQALLAVICEEFENAWTVLAKIQPVDINQPAHGQPVIFSPNPTIEDTLTPPHKFTDHCDHCTSGKRGRQTVYTVTDGSAVKQVGTACLLEYTGITPEMAESWLKLKGNSRIDWATHTGERNKRQHPSMSLTNMAVALALYANTHGRYRSNIGRWIFNSWTHAVPTGNGWGEVGYWNLESNKWTVIEKIHGIEGDGTFMGQPDELPQVSGAVWDTAQDIIKYMTDLSGANNFEHNLRTIANAHVVTNKTAGYAGGALAGWLKRKPEPAPKPMPTVTSQWVGKVGERMTVLPCKVTFVRRIETMYGISTLTKFVDLKGNQLVWFRSGDKNDLTKGQIIGLTATVKKHDSYKDTKQTTVTRGKIDTKPDWGEGWEQD